MTQLINYYSMLTNDKKIGGGSQINIANLNRSLSFGQGIDGAGEESMGSHRYN